MQLTVNQIRWDPFAELFYLTTTLEHTTKMSFIFKRKQLQNLGAIQHKQKSKTVAQTPRILNPT